MRGAWAVALVVLPMVVAQFQPVDEPDFSGFESRQDLTSAGDLEGAERILRFVQVSDAHIIDDDAPYPMRQEPLDMFGSPFTSAQREQEEFTDEVLDSAIQAINAMHAADAFDFVIHTGDNIDNQLENELMRFIDNHRGTHTKVGPVSGLVCVPDGEYAPLDDDSNDETEDCTSLPAGLAANNTPLALGLPWYSAFGNHDGLIQGNVPNEPTFNDIAAGFGRRFIDQHEYVAMHFLAGGQCAGGAPAGQAADHFGQGYGYAGDRLCDEDPDNDGYYAFSLRGVRIVVLDTVNDDFVTGNEELAGVLPFHPQSTIGNDVVGGYAEGSVDPAQFAWLTQEIEDHQDQVVLVFSHHTVNSMFSSQTEEYCEPGVGCLHELLTESGYKTGPELIEALNQYPNVVAWLGGHTHQHRIQTKTVDGAPSPGFWNVETSSLIDFPQEARVVELWQTAGGKAFLRLDPFGHSFERSKELTSQDPQQHPEATGSEEDRAVLLWFDVPDGVSLTPQPELPRGLSLSLVEPAPGQESVPGEEVRLTVQVFDALTGHAVAGLQLGMGVTYPGEGRAAAVEVVPIGTAMEDQGQGRYSLSFTPTEPITHYASVQAVDASGMYPETSRVFSIAMEPGESSDQRSPGPGLLAALAAVALLAAVVRRRA